MKKDADFWNFVKQYDVIGLTETWVEEKNWEKLEKRLPKEYKWKCRPAKREKKRGRASGGIITGVRIDIEVKEREEDDVDDAVKNLVKIAGETWAIWTIYNKGKIRKILKEISEENDQRNLIIGGDLNARTGCEGGYYMGMTRKKVRDARKIKNVTQKENY